MAAAGKRNIFNDACNLEALEGPALEADILPGMLVSQSATGFSKRASAGTVFGYQPVFADYDMAKAGTVDDAWTINENMVARPLNANESANAIVATGQAITAPRTGLASNGDGTLKIAATDGTELIVAYSDEIITTTAATLVRVRGV